MGSHAASSSDCPVKALDKELCSRRGDYSGDSLRKWKSLEGDWKTFSCPGQNHQVRRGYATECRNHKSASGSPTLEGTFGEAGFSIGRQITGFKDGANEDEGDWCAESDNYQYEEDRSCSSGLSKHSDVEFSSGLQQTLHMIGREELRRVVNSSYPLLEENFTLLQKLKKERDVCRQLENDMKDLEGHIQDVSKSFTGSHTTTELDSGDGSCTNSEGGYASDLNAVSPTMGVGGSYQQVFAGENLEEEDHFCRAIEQNQEELDPITVIESTLSNLMDLAERLELSLRERDLEMSQLTQTSSLHHQWARSSLELSRIPTELVDLLQDLQAALRLLLATRGRECKQLRGDRDCTSPASFTFESFDSGPVLVPTVRTIFSPVGDSVKMRLVQRQNGCQESYSSTASLDQCSDVPTEQEDIGEADEGAAIDDPEDILLEEELSRVHQEQRCSTPPANDHQPSSEIIKRIERLQELVKPELCESLKQRALRIQKAKEDFLSGVVTPTQVTEEPAVPQDTQQTDIVIEDITVPSPNGLTVKDQPEDKRPRLLFLRKKKRQSWCSEELCPESLVLEDKSDWLRNPFRPKGKYKISK